jgi:hypothetical protein
MGHHWPWDRKDLNPQEPFNGTTLPSYGESVWLLKTSLVENYRISHPKGQFSTPGGDLMCLGKKFYNDTTLETRGPNLILWLTSLNLQQPGII